jgi:hypothetical protein
MREGRLNLESRKAGREAVSRIPSFVSSKFHLFGFLALALSSCASRPIAERPESDREESRIAALLGRIGIPSGRQVRAYGINMGDDYSSADKMGVINGQLNPKRSPRDGAKLDADQVARLLEATAAKKHEEAVGLCFYPHHTFVFFDSAGRILGENAVCFTCENWRDTTGQFVPFPDYPKLAQLALELHLPREADYRRFLAGSSQTNSPKASQ